MDKGIIQLSLSRSKKKVETLLLIKHEDNKHMTETILCSQPVFFMPSQDIALYNHIKWYISASFCDKKQYQITKAI